MEISNYKVIDKGALKASFTLTIPKWANVQFHNITLMEFNGKRWVSMPSKPYEDKESGKTKYFNYITFKDRDTEIKFKDGVIRSFDEHIKTLPVQGNHSISIGSMMADDSEDDGLPF